MVIRNFNEEEMAEICYAVSYVIDDLYSFINSKEGFMYCYNNDITVDNHCFWFETEWVDEGVIFRGYTFTENNPSDYVQGDILYSDNFSLEEVMCNKEHIVKKLSEWIDKCFIDLELDLHYSYNNM